MRVPDCVTIPSSHAECTVSEHCSHIVWSPFLLGGNVPLQVMVSRRFRLVDTRRLTYELSAGEGHRTKR